MHKCEFKRFSILMWLLEQLVDFNSQMIGQIGFIQSYFWIVKHKMNRVWERIVPGIIKIIISLLISSSIFLPINLLFVYINNTVDDLKASAWKLP